MSEGAGPAAVGPSGGDIDRSFDVQAGIVLILVSLVGPILGFVFSKGHTPLDALQLGYYSLPLALFGAVAFVTPIRNPRDYYGGIMLVALALFALWASNDLPGMRGFAFGPGTAPRLFAYILLALGIAISIVGLFNDGPPAEQFAISGPFGGGVLVCSLIPVTYFANRIGHWLPNVAPDVTVAAVGAIVVLALTLALSKIAPRGTLFITAATLVFAVTVRPLGLIISSYVSLVVSAAATEEVRWIETLVWAAVLTAFCALLFPYGLNLPLQLWPRF